MTNINNNIVPVIYSVDERFIPLISTSIQSIYENRSKENVYKIFVLNKNIKDLLAKHLDKFNCENFFVEYIDVEKNFNKFRNKLCVRDNYSEAIYYRMLIPTIFSEYDKVLYIDCDTLILKDIFDLYNIDLGNKLLGASTDEVVSKNKIFQDYVYNYLHVEPEKYFNSGVLLFNLKEFRRQRIVSKFAELVHKVVYKVAPDQDYLNVLCYDKVKYISKVWNKSPFECDDVKISDIGLIHFNLNLKPWRYDNVPYADCFWDFVKKTEFYDYFKQVKSNMSEEDYAIDNKNFSVLVNIASECAYESKNNIEEENTFYEYKLKATN